MGTSIFLGLLVKSVVVRLVELGGFETMSLGRVARVYWVDAEVGWRTTICSKNCWSSQDITDFAGTHLEVTQPAIRKILLPGIV